MPEACDDKGLLIENKRQPEYPIDKLFINRWSPRAFDPAPIPEDIILSLFEAARWSMSCYNDQPWLFMYASSQEDLKIYRGLLAGNNQLWAASAPVLGFILARRRFSHNDKPNDWAAFDCGAAWMAMTMQARMLGLYTHGMGGFHKDKVYAILGVPKSEYEALCAFALGSYGDRDSLTGDMEKNERPNDRKPLSGMVMQGKFQT